MLILVFIYWHAFNWQYDHTLKDTFFAWKHSIGMIASEYTPARLF